MVKYLILYDFKKQEGLGGYFYKKFKEILSEHNVERVQRSVYLCNDIEVAKKIAEYLRGLGANVRIFEISKEV